MLTNIKAIPGIIKKNILMRHSTRKRTPTTSYFDPFDSGYSLDEWSQCDKSSPPEVKKNSPVKSLLSLFRYLL